MLSPFMTQNISTCMPTPTIPIISLQTRETQEEWEQVARLFDKRWNFPNCLGGLDGKHVRIYPPPPPTQGACTTPCSWTRTSPLTSSWPAVCCTTSVRQGLHPRRVGDERTRGPNSCLQPRPHLPGVGLKNPQRGQANAGDAGRLLYWVGGCFMAT